mmetsp:Transcript_38692/g.121880  ORF Transcript_38692/g.121880 Transcript_38692/m.121880 type:complete len:84 (+) Transcript_38692:205-456(+)
MRSKVLDEGTFDAAGASLKAQLRYHAYMLMDQRRSLLYQSAVSSVISLEGRRGQAEAKGSSKHCCRRCGFRVGGRNVGTDSAL